MIEDSYKGEEDMDDVEEDKYLGDIISKDGRNMKNINKHNGTSGRNSLLEILLSSCCYFKKQSCCEQHAFQQ